MIRSVVTGGYAAESLLNETLIGSENDEVVKALTKAMETIAAAIEELQVNS